MGHYYSEMVSNREWQEKRKREEEWLKNRAFRIKKAIEKEGIEYVLARIVDDPTSASIEFNGHKIEEDEHE